MVSKIYEIKDIYKNSYVKNEAQVNIDENSWRQRSLWKFKIYENKNQESVIFEVYEIQSVCIKICGSIDRQTRGSSLPKIRKIKEDDTNRNLRYQGIVGRGT